MLADRAWDIYDGEDIHGTKLIRLTKSDVLDVTGYRHAFRGTGSGQLVIRRQHAARAYMVKGHYVRCVNLTPVGGGEEVDGGFFLDEGEETVLSDSTRAFKMGGPSTLAYLARAHLDNVTRSPSGGAGDQNWIDTTGSRVWWGPGLRQGFDNIIKRIVVEAWLLPDNPVPALWDAIGGGTRGSDTQITAESAGAPEGYYESPVGANLLDEVMRMLVEGALDIWIDPDTFAIRIVDFDALSVNLTGSAFGAGVVRFEGGVNIGADLTRALHHSNYASHVIAHSGDRLTVVVEQDPDWTAGDPIRYAELTSDVDDVEESYLSTLALRDIEMRKLETDEPSFPHLYGDDEAGGLYTPSDLAGSGHYGPGAYVTLHTGASPGDFNEQTIQVAAVNWMQRANGLYEPVVDLGSQYTTTEQAAADERLGGIGGGCRHCLRLCSAGVDYIISGPGWRSYKLGSEPDNWKDVGFDDSAWDRTKAAAFNTAGLDGMRPDRDYDPGESLLYRREYWLDSGELTGTFTFKYALDNAGTIYVNGVQVAALTGSADSNFESDHATTIAASYFRAGLNCIAIKTTDDGSVNTKAALYIEVQSSNGNAGGTAAPCHHVHRHPDIAARDFPDSHPATAVSYSNVDSGLTAEETQAAIDELASRTWDANPPLTGALSNPPTEAELEAVINQLPVNVPGQRFMVTDSDTDRPYLVVSDGVRFPYTPLIVPSGGSSGGGGGGGGGGSLLEVVSAPAGGWNDRAQVAVHYGGYTYIGLVRGTDGDIRVFATPDADPEAPADRVVVHDNLQRDMHATPSLCIRDSDHRLIVVYSAHNSGACYLWTSTNSLDTDPTLSGGGSRVNLDGQLGGSQYTYMHLFQLLGVTGDPFVLIYRPHPGSFPGHVGQKWAIATSTDDLASWSSGVEFYGGNPSGYITPTQTSDTRIDFVATDDVPDSFPMAMSVYHFYYDGTDGKFYDSDDVEITATQPFDQTALTLVYDGSGAGVGTSPKSVGIGGDGYPRLTFVRLIADEDMELWWAYQDATGWHPKYVTDGQWSGITNGRNRGGSDIDPADVNRVAYARREAGQTEIFVASTSDDGDTWNETAITSSSPVKQVRPHFVINAGAALTLVWSSGTYTSDTSWNMGTRGSDT